ncbi:MAG: hypothetical protein OER87_07540 [Gammaproteobacteria bacterium]|nr:hypothetical protein [Gammaproteobacteria bacterium]MDH3535581.1 hypothetical protein [Gammaproteobacteria bacterium]
MSAVATDLEIQLQEAIAATYDDFHAFVMLALVGMMLIFSTTNEA